MQDLFWAVSYCPSFEAAKKKDTTINLFDEIFGEFLNFSIPFFFLKNY